MRKKVKKTILLLMLTAAMFAPQSLYADVPSGLEVTNIGDITAAQGEGIMLSYTIENRGPAVSFDTVSLELSPWMGTVIAGGLNNKTTLGTGETISVLFSVDIGDAAANGKRYITLTVSEKDNIKYQQAEGTVTVIKGKEAGDTAISMETTMRCTLNPKDGLKAGSQNQISFELLIMDDQALENTINNKAVENTFAEVTLPDGFGVYNSSAIKRLGYVRAGRKTNFSFPIYMEENVKTNFCKLDITITGTLENGRDVHIKKDFYVPVKPQKSESLIDDINIESIEIPQFVEAEKDFKLSFTIRNTGKENLKNVGVSAEIPEGLINKSQSTFVDSFRPGQSREYRITLLAPDKAQKSYGIKISATGGSSSTSGAVSQYASAFVKGDESGKVVKTPQLIVADYSFGGTYAQAGTEFPLTIFFFNTSNGTIKNVKVSISDESDIFVPVKSSNSFFFDRIDKKNSTSHSLSLKANPETKQGTVALAVDMSYENAKGEVFTAKDIISIPVIQEQRLVIDDAVQPGELYSGIPAEVSVSFYNMGKSILNNLSVNAYGDFGAQETNRYYAGNMEPGKSETYDFTIIPNKFGTMNGIIEFTYEDERGSAQIFQRTFQFSVSEEMTVGASMEEPSTEQRGLPSYSIYMGAGISIIILIASILIFKKIKRQREENQSCKE